MNSIRTAVIGVGYLGRFHAEKYMKLASSQLVAVCDLNYEQAKTLADQLSNQSIDKSGPIHALQNYRDLLGQVDAVSIATPTPYHAEVAEFFLQHGVHVLIEKPITLSLEEADHLIHLAKQHQTILQVGHLERFNPAFRAAMDYLDRNMTNPIPQKIKAKREASYKLRGTDVNVVLDMMIHDIDLVLTIANNSPILQIEADGYQVESSSLDVVSTRIQFESGLIAELYASRVSNQMQRHWQLDYPETRLAIDLHAKHLKTTHTIPVLEQDALYEEISHFLHCIHHQATPQVTGEHGRNALALALKITEKAHEKHVT
jgi:predicted dehydrogenase